MVAAGCLLLVILPLAGLVLGLIVGSKAVAIWCALGGLTIAIAICGTSVYALVKAGRHS
jgi:hypothetical protein